MSVCTFIASDRPLREAAPKKEYPLIINIDEDTVYDGGADDNFYLRDFKDVQCYTDKKYGVCLEWQYTDERAKKILEYIEDALEHEAAIEIWHVWLMDYWLMDYCEYEESPVIQKCTVSFSDLTIDDIKEIDCAEIWNKPDKRNPGRPSFYCLIIKQ